MFPGAGAERGEGAYAVVGAPLDVSTSHRPGTRFGPREIRQAGLGFEDFDHHTAQHFTELQVHDHGDVDPWEDVPDYLAFLEGELSALDREGLVPLLLGGEHTVTIAAIRALEPTTFVTLDAHLDLREAYRDNPLSHATVGHHALDVVEEVVILGGRAGSEAEWDRAASANVTAVPPVDVADWNPAFDGGGYLSVDIDAADPAYAPGTGTPEPFGLDSRTMHRVVRDLAPACVGFDVVEVNDRDDGQAATLAAKLLRAFVFEHATE